MLSSSNEKEKCPLYESEYNERIRIILKMDTKFAEKAASLAEKEMLDYLHSYLLRKGELLAETFA